MPVAGMKRKGICAAYTLRRGHEKTGLPQGNPADRYAEVIKDFLKNSGLTVAWRLFPKTGKTRSQSKIGGPSYGAERTGFCDGSIFAQDATFGGRVLAEERF